MAFLFFHSTNPDMSKMLSESVSKIYSGTELFGGQLFKKNKGHAFYTYKEKHTQKIFIDGPVLSGEIEFPISVSRLKNWSGEFCGIFCSKGEISFFGNHTGSRKLFYLFEKETLIVSTSLLQLNYMSRKAGYKPSLKEESIWSLLSYGYLPENLTLLKNAYRIRPGEYITYDKRGLHRNFYHRFVAEKNYSFTETQWINQLENTFENAFRRIYKTDPAHQHTLTLSGGLDSRMVLGQFIIQKKVHPSIYCMSQSNYDDHLISKQIAEDYKLDYHFTALDNGNYLKNVEENILLNDGLTLYPGTAHFLKLLKEYSLAQYPFLYTGLIGDAILAGFNTSKKENKPNFKTGAFSQMFLNQTEEMLRPYRLEYHTEEDFSFYSRLSNGVMNGVWIAEPYTIVVSPFMDTNFIALSLSIPAKLKFRHRLYLKWLQEKHLWMTKYKWEAVHDYPKRNRQIKARYWNKVKKLWRSHVLNSDLKTSMNPYVHWGKHNPILIEELETRLLNNLEYLNNNNLIKASQKLFRNGGLLEKTLAVTAVITAKAYLEGWTSSK